jgi:hypothetical protein
MTQFDCDAFSTQNTHVQWKNPFWKGCNWKYHAHAQMYQNKNVHCAAIEEFMNEVLRWRVKVNASREKVKRISLCN